MHRAGEATSARGQATGVDNTRKRDGPELGPGQNVAGSFDDNMTGEGRGGHRENMVCCTLFRTRVGWMASGVAGCGTRRQEDVDAIGSRVVKNVRFSQAELEMH